MSAPSNVNVKAAMRYFVLQYLHWRIFPHANYCSSCVFIHLVSIFFVIQHPGWKVVLSLMYLGLTELICNEGCRSHEQLRPVRMSQITDCTKISKWLLCLSVWPLIYLGLTYLYLMKGSQLLVTWATSANQNATDDRLCTKIPQGGSSDHKP